MAGKGIRSKWKRELRRRWRQLLNSVMEAKCFIPSHCTRASLALGVPKNKCAKPHFPQPRFSIPAAVLAPAALDTLVSPSHRLLTLADATFRLHAEDFAAVQSLCYTAIAAGSRNYAAEQSAMRGADVCRACNPALRLWCQMSCAYNACLYK
jgi:hypothetical protein